MPQPLYPVERVPGSHWIGGCIDLRASLDTGEEKNILSLPDIESQFTVQPAVQSLY
jgi:hypothetical protein